MSEKKISSFRMLYSALIKYYIDILQGLILLLLHQFFLVKIYIIWNKLKKALLIYNYLKNLQDGTYLT